LKSLRSAVVVIRWKKFQHNELQVMVYYSVGCLTMELDKIPLVILVMAVHDVSDRFMVVANAGIS
jgi:hypothetical protein